MSAQGGEWSPARGARRAAFGGSAGSPVEAAADGAALREEVRRLRTQLEASEAELGSVIATQARELRRLQVPPPPPMP